MRHVVSTLIGLAVVAGTGFAAYHTRERWLPHVLPAGESAKADDDHHGHEHGAAEDRVKLSPQAQQNLALDVDNPTPTAYWRTLMIPGMVVDRPGESDRGVTSRVAGVVASVKARPGESVQPGDTLFIIQLASEFLQSAQTDLAKSGRELEFATAKRDRVAALVSQGTQSGAVLIEEENQVKRITTQVQAFRRQLQLFGLTPEQVNRVEKGEVITEVQVTAPVHPTNSPLNAYEVQELKVHLGEQVTAGQTLCLLANHLKLYVEGRAFKSEADALAAAAEKKLPIRAEFTDEVAGAWPAQEPLVVHHLANQVDPAARTFGFYLPLENQRRSFTRDDKTYFVWRYRPGQRVRLRVPVEKLVTLAADGTEVLPFVLPAGAVAREGGESYVFVQSGDVFIRKAVRVLYEDRRDAVIANDGSITEAEFVVRNNAAALNRALKASAGGHEGHDHDH
ncbi:MAG: efflux RND transporter periplasmic adaptor subunit [Gemmataceae bacterium]